VWSNWASSQTHPDTEDTLSQTDLLEAHNVLASQNPTETFVTHTGGGRELSPRPIRLRCALVYRLRDAMLYPRGPRLVLSRAGRPCRCWLPPQLNIDETKVDVVEEEAPRYVTTVGHGTTLPCARADTRF
jgi:hypothetical protein